MNQISFLLLLQLFYLPVFCQQAEGVPISLGIVFKHVPVILHDSVYKLENGSELKFETLKFYLSNIQLFQNNAAVYTEPNSFHLIDLEDSASQNIFLRLSKDIGYNQVKFNLGIDSTTNVSGVLGGDLDPTKGMYWTWKSGYINFKMEGTCRNGHTPENDFEFHAGGYQYPFNALQKIELSTAGDKNLPINLDLHQFFTALDLVKQKHIMSPGAEAVALSRQLAHCFSVK